MHSHINYNTNITLITRCCRESLPGKKTPCKIDIEVKIETEGEKTTIKKYSAGKPISIMILHDVTVPLSLFLKQAKH